MFILNDILHSMLRNARFQTIEVEDNIFLKIFAIEFLYTNYFPLYGKFLLTAKKFMVYVKFPIRTGLTWELWPNSSLTEGRSVPQWEVDILG